MQDIRIKIADVKEQIERRIRHPYLLKHIEAPIIEKDKLMLLISIFDQVNISEKQRTNYVITTMLIQIALDTHELVSNQPLEDEDNKNRQLTVLAGVYYSGLYYKILAGMDDVNMIRVLAEGIKEVNEHKISVYRKAFDGIEVLMNNVKKVESSLFDKIAEYLDVPVWSEFVSNLLFVKRLNAEKKLFLQGGTSVVFEALKKISFQKSEQMVIDITIEQQNHLLRICDRYIDFSKQLIEQNSRKLPIMNELLGNRMKAIINQHQAAANTFVEEG